MSPTAQTLFDSAMALSAEDRAALAKALAQACRPPMTHAEGVASSQPEGEGMISSLPDSTDEYYRPPTPGSRLGFAPGIITWIAPDFDDELPMEFWMGGNP